MTSTTASYPPPPPYYRLYKGYLQNPKSAPEPPPPINGTYQLYGATYTTDDVLPSLEDQGVRQLYPKGHNVDCKASRRCLGVFLAKSIIFNKKYANILTFIVLDYKKELRSLNRELQLHILELADVLVERPSQYARRVEDISLIFKNLHHLLNSLRPHQARATLIHILELQLQRRKQAVEDIKRRREEAQRLLKESLGTLDGQGNPRCLKQVNPPSTTRVMPCDIFIEVKVSNAWLMPAFEENVPARAIPLALYGRLQERFLGISAFTRQHSTESIVQTEDPPPVRPNDGQGFKGHDMLAPFTAGWQTTDVNPLVIDKSEGSYVYDINGKKYLDALAGLWCTALGGNEPRLIAAATAQLNTLPFYHSFWNRTTKPSLDLAKELLDTFTARQMGKVFFTNSGSEANDSQVKLVWYYNNALGRPEKKKFIARWKSYHGSTLISASLSGLPALHQKFDLPAPFVLHTDCPHYWRFHLPGESEEEFSTRLANNLENLILKEGPETIAAFIAEPVMGAGGVIPPPATYFDKIQAVVKKYDILFIADEVSTYTSLSSFSHGFTYSGHPVSCAVSLEAVKIYKERNITEHVKSISPRFQDGIKAFSDSPIIGEIRGNGLILGTEFTDNKSPSDLFPAEWGVGAIFGSECEKRGMLVRVAGDNIMMSPPLIMSPKEVDELISIYGEALQATEKR
ncbi:hypothetical protein Syun_010784 [Stephania yunnanensis]|uniref:Uncharacterized protein n=2 Tax=Magnoliopsida TaxID=3398 RepID=A0AAP0KJR2_9MAGN